MSPVSPRSGTVTPLYLSPMKNRPAGALGTMDGMNAGSPGIGAELLDASPDFLHHLLRLPAQSVVQREARRDLPLVVGEEAHGVFARIGEVARGLAEGMLIAQHKARHGEARHVVGEVEAAVLEVGVVDVRLIQFEIVAKVKFMLALGPGEEVANIAGIADELGVSEVADGKVAGDGEAADAALRLGQLPDA